MFKQSGIPYIVTINEEYVDESYELFQSQLYKFILNGKSVEKSFQNAVKAVDEFYKEKNEK